MAIRTFGGGYTPSANQGSSPTTPDISETLESLGLDVESLMKLLMLFQLFAGNETQGNSNGGPSGNSGAGCCCPGNNGSGGWGGGDQWSNPSSSSGPTPWSDFLGGEDGGSNSQRSNGNGNGGYGDYGNGGSNYSPFEPASGGDWSNLTAGPGATNPIRPLPGSPTGGLAGAGGGAMIGAAVNSNNLDDPRYRQTLADNFNSVTPEYEMKWKTLQGKGPGAYNWGPADRIVDFANEHNMQVRGHALVWDDDIPDWVNNLPPDEMRKTMLDHISTTVGRYKGKVASWDVVNEALPKDDSDVGRDGLGKSPIADKLGKDYIKDAFRAAREADPDAKLIYNEAGSERGAKFENLYNMIKEMKAEGVPIDRVDFQMHLYADHHPSGAEIQNNVRRLRELGVEVGISEMTVNGGSPEQQAQIYGEIIRGAKAGGATDFSFWGFTDGVSIEGDGNPLFFDRNYNKKPSYYAIEEALRGG